MADGAVAEHFDIVIVGAGIAGSALAGSLTDASLRIALLEALPRERLLGDEKNDTEGVQHYDARVSALTESSRNFLQAIGVWDCLDPNDYLDYAHMHVWDALGTASIDFDASEVHQPALGTIIENRKLLRAAHGALSDQENLSMFWAEAPSKMEQQASSGVPQTLIHTQNHRFSADLVIAADGANSKMRTMLGFESREWDYGQHAIVATVRTERSHQQTAWQRFSEDGPLAFLPLADDAETGHYCSIVWSIESDLAQKLFGLSDEAFARELERAFESRLGRIEAVSARQMFPLRQRHALDYVKENAVLVGDAAHTIHPLAGQGLNLGLKDVALLSTILQEAAGQHLSCSHPLLLRRYQRARKTENLAVMATMEGFHRFFGASDPGVRALRNFGLSWVNKQSLLKKAMIRQAIGV